MNEKTQYPMLEVTAVQVAPVNIGDIRAFASVTLNNQIELSGIRVCNGPEEHLLLEFPYDQMLLGSIYSTRGGLFGRIREAVLAEYHVKQEDVIRQAENRQGGK